MFLLVFVFIIDNNRYIIIIHILFTILWLAKTPQFHRDNVYHPMQARAHPSYSKHSFESLFSPAVHFPQASFPSVLKPACLYSHMPMLLFVLCIISIGDASFPHVCSSILKSHPRRLLSKTQPGQGEVGYVKKKKVQKERKYETSIEFVKNFF